MPVVLLYAVGALLIVFGSLRAVYLGWQRRDREIADDDSSRRKQGPRYHLMVGLFWVGLGLFLVISTYLQTHR